MPRRFVVALAAIAAVLLVTDVVFLASGLHRVSRERTRALEVLQPRLTARSQTIRDLQTKSDAERESVFAAIRLMDEIYDLGRRSERIGQAHAKWAGASEAMDRARESSMTLKEVTAKLLAELGSQRRDAQSLLELVENQAEVDYTRSVVTAYSSMSETHQTYKKLNVKLDEGLKLYEDLSMRTSDFLTKEKSRSFRSKREAADFYTVETQRGGLAQAIEKFNEELSTLQQEAAGAVQRTSQAFGVVESNQKKLP